MPAAAPSSQLTQLTSREVRTVITAHRQTEGAGFVVRRPLPSPGLSLQLADPFLLLDEMGPIDYAPGAALGAPDHPHRGFETVTYLLAGAAEHQDSAGHRGTTRAGDVQWMTAGSGIVHSELPAKHLREGGGRMHGFQIWVNLPARLKRTPPRYQAVPAATMPTGRSSDGLAEVKVIAGQALDVGAAIATHTPIVYLDWTLQPGAEVWVDLPQDHTGLVYVFGGAALVGEGRRKVADGQLAVLAPGDRLLLRSDQGARLLVLGGVPHGEPIAHYGPFVMNTQTEIQEAIQDYQSGRMGRIVRS